MVGRKMVPVVPRTTGQDERLLCQTWSDENERERERKREREQKTSDSDVNANMCKSI